MTDSKSDADREFCEICGVSLDLHDFFSGVQCDTAVQKETLIRRFFGGLVGDR